MTVPRYILITVLASAIVITLLASNAQETTAATQSKIIIRSLGINSTIVFPTATDRNFLKQMLDKGVVHYPLAAYPHEPQGNVFLFGHSSARRFRNPAWNVFTNLGQLKPGAEIEVWYRDQAYVYRTTQVKILKPRQAEVYLTTPRRMLTLSTCWPVGDPSNRFVVEAEFVKSYPLQNVALR